MKSKISYTLLVIEDGTRALEGTYDTDLERATALNNWQLQTTTVPAGEEFIVCGESTTDAVIEWYDMRDDLDIYLDTKEAEPPLPRTLFHVISTYPDGRYPEETAVDSFVSEEDRRQGLIDRANELLDIAEDDDRSEISADITSDQAVTEIEALISVKLCLVESKMSDYADLPEWH